MGSNISELHSDDDTEGSDHESNTNSRQPPTNNEDSDPEKDDRDIHIDQTLGLSKTPLPDDEIVRQPPSSSRKGARILRFAPPPDDTDDSEVPEDSDPPTQTVEGLKKGKAKEGVESKTRQTRVLGSDQHITVEQSRRFSDSSASDEESID